jgi:hypothetical protein
LSSSASFLLPGARSAFESIELIRGLQYQIEDGNGSRVLAVFMRAPRVEGGFIFGAIASMMLVAGRGTGAVSGGGEKDSRGDATYTAWSAMM